jgi:hypothetical protein
LIKEGVGDGVFQAINALEYVTESTRTPEKVVHSALKVTAVHHIARSVL